MTETVTPFRSRLQLAWANYIHALVYGSEQAAREAWAVYAAELPRKGQPAPVGVSVAKEGQG